MSHLTPTTWHGYATEPRRVEITVTSGLDADDIASAELRIRGLTPVEMTASTVPGGYKLVADPVTLPSNAGSYPWTAEVADTSLHEPLVVAVGMLRVTARTEVAE